jgi:peptidoglycan/xylan/chitin deacetylase (PgdA/CDA1 family)
MLCSLGLALCAGVASPAAASAAVGDQLLFNRGFEAAVDTTNTAPAGWTAGTWSNPAPTPPTVTFTWASDAHTGNRSARVEVSGYTDGDSKWVPDPVKVSGGAYYTFSDWYKSNASTAVSVYYETDTNADGVTEGHWANLFSGIPAASEWTQYKTGFAMPAGAIRAQFVHLIARNGWLQTDDYSLTEQASPPGFRKPMISLTFDDGSQGYWANARELVKAKGFKTTQYIPTLGLMSGDPFNMTPDQISTLAGEGNEIGGHTVNHGLLTATATEAELADELITSKNQLQAIPGVGTVRNFAYPFGDYDARVIAATQASGYRSARSVEEGYNSTVDLEPYDIRVQNMTRDTTPAQFNSWVDFAKAHNYWLVVVYHQVLADSTAPCSATLVAGCLGPYDTTVSGLKAQLDSITAAGLGGNVVTVQQALDVVDAELHTPAAGTVKITPAAPATNDTVTADPSGFSDPDGDALTYQYEWKVNGKPIAGANAKTFDLSVPGHGDAGDVVAVDVSARDPKGLATTGVSDQVTVKSTTAPPPPPVTPDPPPPVTPDPVVQPVPGPNPPVVARDTNAPNIVVSSPKARKYKAGQTLKIKIACTDASGFVRWSATVRRGGDKARMVRQGTKLRLSRPGSYVLRVIAKDGAGNLAAKTVRFRVLAR